ncbi:MAG: hypothetical protein H6Q89_1749 [Myxococcaceae bacterium]|nr:hypothetical protein [Myxococcaceae bacterium]
MGTLAAEFSGSRHSQPARQRYARADRRWKRTAIIATLAPTLVAGLVAAAALAPGPLFPRLPRNALIAALDVRPPAKPPAALRTVSLRGNPMPFGQGALAAAAKEGPARPFTLTHTEVVADVTGFVSSVTVTQQFENPFTEPVEAVYVFPLPEDAAVNELVLTAGGRVTRATIQRRAEARRKYDEARAQGRSAALLDQERPNIFTQSVANLLPGESVKVTLTYVAPVRYDDGEFTFNFPMVVAPRYLPGTGPDPTDGLDAARISPPTERTGRDIAVKVRINAGSPIEAMSSGSHRLRATQSSVETAEITLDPADQIHFADTASTFEPSPVLSTPQNVQRAIAYLGALQPAGGTNQLAGLGRALTQPEDPERLRMVLLMTDGFIGNEGQILAATEQHLGKARLFGFGIGTSVNHYLLARLSEVGRGFYQYLRPDEDPQSAIERFVRRIERPLLTDVEVDWGDLQVREVLPRKIPDLFDAQPLILVGRNLNAGRGTVTVKGKLRGVTVETKVEVTVAPTAFGNTGLPAIWARARIAELERQQYGAVKAEVIEQITTLGLEHHLVTAYTSLVAIGEEQLAPPALDTVVEPSPPVAQSPVVPKPAPAQNIPEDITVDFGDGRSRGDEDDFNQAFGAGDSLAQKPQVHRKYAAPYLPPAPGQRESRVKESLGQADIFEVISGYKPALARCVEEHRKRQPGVSGKLVLRWKITAAGKVFDVEVVSTEFKDTYVAGCISALAKSWIFPKHKAAGDPVVFPFKF